MIWIVISLILIGVVGLTVPPAFAQIQNTNVEIQIKDQYWQNYFDYGDIVYGQAYYFDESKFPEKVNQGIADIRMTTPSGVDILVAQNLPIQSSYVDFQIPIANDFELGMYTLRAITTIHELPVEGNHQQIFYVGQDQHFEYLSDEGTLTVDMQYIEYDLSPLRFDIDSKSLSFDFKRIDGNFDDNQLQFDRRISMVIERPLISPPFSIVFEPKSHEILAYDVKPYKVKLVDGYYEFVILLDDAWDEGTVTLIGTYAIPEFQTIAMMILFISIIPLTLARNKLFRI